MVAEHVTLFAKIAMAVHLHNALHVNLESIWQTILAFHVTSLVQLVPVLVTPNAIVANLHLE